MSAFTRHPKKSGRVDVPPRLDYSELRVRDVIKLPVTAYLATMNVPSRKWKHDMSGILCDSVRRAGSHRPEMAERCHRVQWNDNDRDFVCDRRFIEFEVAAQPFSISR
jgi:hypothetical protein